MSDIVVDVQIPRPVEVVRRWWIEFPEVYENAREQRWTRAFGTGR